MSPGRWGGLTCSMSPGGLTCSMSGKVDWPAACPLAGTVRMPGGCQVSWESAGPAPQDLRTSRRSWSLPNTSIIKFCHFGYSWQSFKSDHPQPFFYNITLFCHTFLESCCPGFARKVFRLIGKANTVDITVCTVHCTVVVHVKNGSETASVHCAIRIWSANKSPQTL